MPNFAGSKIFAIVCWIENAPSQEEAESFNWNWGSSWGFVAATEMLQLPCRTKCASPQTIQMFWSMPCPLWKLQSRYFLHKNEVSGKEINFTLIDLVLLHLRGGLIFWVWIPWRKAFLVFSPVLEGISYWNVFYELTLTDKNMQARICFKVILTFWDYGIWLSSTSFLKKFHILASTASDRNCIRY